MNAVVQYSPDQIALIKRTVAQGATDDELNLFIYDCQRRNIHPLDKLLHFTKRGGRYVPITSIDLMRSRAAETGQMAGSDDAVIHEGDGQYPEEACVTVWRSNCGQRYPYSATARWKEYYPGDAAGAMWRKMPHVMLAKCAEALALRKAFPQELAGLYAKEEMDQADVPVKQWRAVPNIGPNVIQTAETIVSPKAQQPAADHVTVPQQEPAAKEPHQPPGGGLPNERGFIHGKPIPPVATEAFAIASQGMSAYERWWLTLSTSERKQLLPYHETLKEAAREADQKER